MSDPIAQAAQQLNEQKPEGIAGEIMGAMHALEEKVDHFLHPDAPAVAQSGELAGTTSQPVADTTSKSSAPLVMTAQPTLPTPADTPQPSSDAQTAGEAGNASAAQAAAASTNPSATGSQDASHPLTSGDLGRGVDSPNVAPAAAAQPATQPSVLVASMPAGTPTTGVSSPAGRIRSHLSAIRTHLSIRGFEQSAVADIHKELDAIERWL
jgi:hypothetical protein